jgi:hypothetical protein
MLSGEDSLSPDFSEWGQVVRVPLVEGLMLAGSGQPVPVRPD